MPLDNGYTSVAVLTDGIDLRLFQSGDTVHPRPMLRRQRDLGKSEVIAARIEKIAQALTVGFRVRSHICDEAIYTGLGDGILCVPFCTVPDVGTPRDIQRGISLINRLALPV